MFLAGGRAAGLEKMRTLFLEPVGAETLRWVRSPLQLAPPSTQPPDVTTQFRRQPIGHSKGLGEPGQTWANRTDDRGL